MIVARKKIFHRILICHANEKVFLDQPGVLILLIWRSKGLAPPQQVRGVDSSVKNRADLLVSSIRMASTTHAYLDHRVTLWEMRGLAHEEIFIHKKRYRVYVPFFSCFSSLYGLWELCITAAWI